MELDWRRLPVRVGKEKRRERSKASASPFFEEVVIDPARLLSFADDLVKAGRCECSTREQNRPTCQTFRLADNDTKRPTPANCANNPARAVAALDANLQADCESGKGFGCRYSIGKDEDRAPKPTRNSLHDTHSPEKQSAPIKQLKEKQAGAKAPSYAFSSLQVHATPETLFVTIILARADQQMESAD